MAKAKCKNTASCDLAINGDLIEIPEDGRCPECRSLLQNESVAGGNNTFDDDRKKRVRTIAIGSGVVATALIGVLVVAFQNSDSPTAESNQLPIATLEQPEKLAPLELPKEEPVPVVLPELKKEETPPPAPVSVASPEPAPAPPVSNEPSLETKQHVKQGMVYVSMAKQNKSTQAENIKNALVEFDAAVKAEETQGRCYASALMNRGIAYWIDKKLNLAEKDLVKASECNDKDPIIFYNMVSYYSAINKPDLALEPLNKALDLGFKDCDILRKDSDLKNLRKMDEFHRALEQHQLFCLR